MRSSVNIRAKLLGVFACLLGLSLGLGLTFDSAAQAAPAAPTVVAAPDFTTQSLRAELDALEVPDAEGDEPADGLTDDQREQMRSFLNNGVNSLEAAARQGEIATQFNTRLETGESALNDLRNEVQALQTELSAREPMDGEADLVGEVAMFATEQSLLAKESELRALQSELEGYRTQTTEIGARLTAAPRELNAARTQLGEVSSELTSVSGAELDRVAETRRKSFRAREFSLRRQISALEAEISSLPLRQDIVTARRNLAELRADALGEEVLTLQNLTGQRKVVEAAQQAQRARDFVDSLSDTHPLVTSMAAENLRLADMMTAMARDESATSRRLASVRGITANVQNDLTAATELVSLGQLDREAGATLRRLGNQLTPALQLRADLRDTQRALARLTRQRVVAQEQLRDLPIGAIDPDALLQQARSADPTIEPLSDTASEAVRQLAEQRRAFLRQIASNATGRINAVAELQTAQNELTDRTEELRTVLDENLLWVPSVPAISFDWPQKVVLGAVELFSPMHVQPAVNALLTQSRRLWPIVLLFGLGIALAFRLRPGLWEDILKRADYVGRVRQDTLWHTPAVIGAGVIMALPWPLLFCLLAILFGASNNPDLLVGGLSDGFAYLSFFSLLIVTWNYWDRDRSLFAAHFKLHKALRLAVQKNLRWFLPVVGTTSFLLAVTSGMRGENI